MMASISVQLWCCLQVGVPGGASMGMMGSWPSPNCVCNDFWQQTYQRTGVLEFSRDRCGQLLPLLLAACAKLCRTALLLYCVWLQCGVPNLSFASSVVVVMPCAVL